MKGGYHGRLLRVNLTERSCRFEDMPDKLFEDYLGGRGLGTKLLFDEVPAKTDALGPDNKLYFVTAPLNGLAVPTSSRFEVVTKSPLTNTVVGANSGGHFGYDLKTAGIDVLVIEGATDAPCYLRIDGGEAEIKDASHVWGKDVHEATDILLEETDAKAGVACIGPSGEKLSLISAIMNEKNRCAGRGGVGAVMGSKKLKAVVVTGKEKTKVAKEEAFAAANKKWRMYIGEAPLTKNALKEYGTPVLVKVINSNGAFPSCNFKEGVFNNADSISAETIKELYFVKARPCRGCPIACGRYTATPEREGEGPEYETVWAFGALCGISDLEKILHANYNCNELGIDTISTGSTIACAMELSEKGYLDDEAMAQIRKDLGRDLKFGDAEAIVRFSELIGKVEGFGAVMALGSKRLAEKYGHPELSMNVKGLELAAYDPRGFQGMGLALATNNRGGCHLRSYLIGTEALATPFAVNRHTSDGKAMIVKLYQELTATIDSMGVCAFTIFALNPDLYAEIVASVTGMDIGGKELLKIGERIWNIEKLFNIREGFARKDDSLPKRIMDEPLPFGHSKGRKVSLDVMLDEFYKLRGWTEEGMPTKGKLAELDLVEEGKNAGVI